MPKGLWWNSSPPNQHHRLQFLSQFDNSSESSAHPCLYTEELFADFQLSNSNCLTQAFIKLNRCFKHQARACRGSQNGAGCQKETHPLFMFMFAGCKIKFSGMGRCGAVRQRIASGWQCAEPSPEKWESQCAAPWIGALFFFLFSFLFSFLFPTPSGVILTV